MKAPTQQQLKDPAWWIREAPEWATRAGLGGAGKQPLWASVKQYQYMDSRAIYLFGANTNLSLFDVEWVGDRPAEARPCPVCSETPCGHYNECPPGKARAERLKQLEIERDACLLEDALAEDTKPQAPEWDGEDWQILCDYMLCGSFPVELNAGDKIKVHGVVDVGFGEVLLISDLKVAGTGTIVKSQVAPVRTKEQRERDELSETIAKASAVLAGVMLEDWQYDKIAEALITDGWRKGDS